MKDIIKVLFLSMLPISELRGAIPLGIGLGMSPMKATIISVFGNSLIIPVLLFIMIPILNWMKSLEFFKKLVEKFENRAERKFKKSKNFEKYKFLTLVLFIGIPLPTTGVYTGIVASQLFNMSYKKTLLASLLGVLMSGTIVYLLSSGIKIFI